MICYTQCNDVLFRPIIDRKLWGMGSCIGCTTVMPDGNWVTDMCKWVCFKFTICKCPSFSQFGPFSGHLVFLTYLRGIPLPKLSTPVWCTPGIKISVASWGQTLVTISQNVLHMQFCHVVDLHFVRDSEHMFINCLILRHYHVGAPLVHVTRIQKDFSIVTVSICQYWNEKKKPCFFTQKPRVGWF